MKRMLMAACAAVAMVGAARAAASYDYIANVFFAPYAAYDVNPGTEGMGYYSVYALTQSSAQAAMGVSSAVTADAYATWLGSDFPVTRAKTAEEGMAVGAVSYIGGNNWYQFAKGGGIGTESELSGSIIVCLFDDGTHLAYKVMSHTWNYLGFFAQDSGGAATWVEAPEPTGGLLLLLGVAGLALRRRRA